MTFLMIEFQLIYLFRCSHSWLLISSKNIYRRWEYCKCHRTPVIQGTKMDGLKLPGTTHMDRERLNMCMNTPANCSEHAVMTQPGIPSGPAALQVLTCLKDFRMSVSSLGLIQLLHWPLHWIKPNGHRGWLAEFLQASYICKEAGPAGIAGCVII